MAVSENRIIEKMRLQLEAAQATENREIRRSHVSNIQLLCELLLEEETNGAKQSVARPLSVASVNHADMPVIRNKKQNEIDEDGDSIFDF